MTKHCYTDFNTYTKYVNLKTLQDYTDNQNVSKNEKCYCIDFVSVMY